MASKTFHVLLQVAVLQVALKMSNSHSSAFADPSKQCVALDAFKKQLSGKGGEAYFLLEYTNLGETACFDQCERYGAQCNHCILSSTNQCALITYRKEVAESIESVDDLVPRCVANEVLKQELQEEDQDAYFLTGYTATLPQACLESCVQSRLCKRCIMTDQNQCALVTYDEHEGEGVASQKNVKKRKHASRTPIWTRELPSQTRGENLPEVRKLRPVSSLRRPDWFHFETSLVEGGRLPVDAAMLNHKAVAPHKVAADATSLEEEVLAAHEARMAPAFADEGEAAARKQTAAGGFLTKQVRSSALADKAAKAVEEAAGGEIGITKSQAVEEAAAGEIGITKSQVVNGLSTLSMIKEAAQVLTSYAVDRVR